MSKRLIFCGFAIIFFALFQSGPLKENNITAGEKNIVSGMGTWWPIGSILYARKYGLFDNFTFTNRIVEDSTNDWANVQYQNELFYNDIQAPDSIEWMTYTSALRLPRKALTALHLGLENVRGENLSSIRYMVHLNVLIHAMVLLLILIWIFNQIGPMSSLFATLFCLSSGILIGQSSSTNWVYLLPLAYSLWCYNKGSSKYYFGLFVVAFLGFSKSYLLVPILFANALIAPTYYAIKEADKIILSIKTYIKEASIHLLALIAVVTVHSFGSSVYLQKHDSFLDLIILRLKTRTGLFGSVNRETAPIIKEQHLDIINESIGSSMMDMLRSYLFKGEVLFGLPIYIWIIIAIFGFLGAYWTPQLRSRLSRKSYALLALCSISFLGVIANYILFKAHALVHLHIDYIFWSLPFTLLLGALYGQLIYDATDTHLTRRWIPSMLVLLVSSGLMYSSCFTRYRELADADMMYKDEQSELALADDGSTLVYSIPSQLNKSEYRFFLHVDQQEGGKLNYDFDVNRGYAFFEDPFFMKGEHYFRKTKVSLNQSFFVTGQYNIQTGERLWAVRCSEGSCEKE